MTSEGVQALCQGIAQKPKGAVGAESIGATPEMLSEVLPQLPKKDLKMDQNEDML